jgi:formylglycine-generating enzyme required for sulfatase activity
VWFGCSPDDAECEEDEKPGREVPVEAFFIDKLEVRVRDYEACASKRNCSPSGLSGYALGGGSFGVSSRCNWRRDGREDYPLNCITHSQAASYCEWLGKRLPTEIEWERAARGDDKRIFPWGNEPADCERTVMGTCGQEGAWPSGSQPKDRSPWGALDMGGNVREWVDDWYSAEAYAASDAGAPPAPQSGTERVARGGSWGNGVSRFMRISERGAYTPETRSVYVGFRCARSAK